MENNNLKFDFKDDTLWICIIGETEHHSAAQMRMEIDEKILELCPKQVVLDLSQTDFVDSSGLGLVLGRYTRVQEIQGELVIANPSEHILKILKCAGVDRVMKIEYFG